MSTEEPQLSPFIDLLCERLRRNGFTVNPHAVRLPVSGRIDYRRRRIDVNQPSAEAALIALAHEAGHAEHFLGQPKLERLVSRRGREQCAWLLGAAILRELAVPAGVMRRYDEAHREAMARPRARRAAVRTRRA